jgi:hypothetical protein
MVKAGCPAILCKRWPTAPHRKLTTTIKRSADGSRVSLGHDEHAGERGREAPDQQAGDGGLGCTAEADRAATWRSPATAVVQNKALVASSTLEHQDLPHRPAAGALEACGFSATVIAEWQDGHDKAGGRAEAARRLEEAHQLLDEISNMLTEMRLNMLGAAIR